MADVWTVSNWSIGEADPSAFVTAFRRSADAATASGGAREGMILQDAELAALVAEGGEALVLTKVADLGREGLETGRARVQRPLVDPLEAAHTDLTLP
jgi:hypothetical protein